MNRQTPSGLNKMIGTPTWKFPKPREPKHLRTIRAQSFDGPIPERCPNDKRYKLTVNEFGVGDKRGQYGCCPECGYVATGSTKRENNRAIYQKPIGYAV